MARSSRRQLELEEGILNAVDSLDNCDGSRVNLVSTLDVVRETLVNAYGDSFQEDYDEMFGVDSDETDESDEFDETDDSDEIDDSDEE